MPARFRAVVENSPNVIKYNCTGGTVIIDCQKTPDEMLRVGVADIGYDSSKWRDQLLRPFSRLAGKNTNIEGTGLGLSICKQLIEAVGGEIGFESRVCQGFTFWVGLPVAGKRPSGKGRPSPKKTRTVLYVGDGQTNKPLMQTILCRLPEHYPAYG